MEVGHGLVLGENEQVGPAVVVEVAPGQAPADTLNLPGWARLVGDVGEMAPVVAEHQPGRHGVGGRGAEVVDVAVGGGQVEPAVVVGVEERDSKAQEKAGLAGQADARRRSR